MFFFDIFWPNHSCVCVLPGCFRIYLPSCSTQVPLQASSRNQTRTSGNDGSKADLIQLCMAVFALFVVGRGSLQSVFVITVHILCMLKLDAWLPVASFNASDFTKVLRSAEKSNSYL